MYVYLASAHAHLKKLLCVLLSPCLRLWVPQIPDAADQCLLEERSHLLSVKRSLEAQLRKAQQQQQVLSVARAQLAAIIQERSRVTDLLCHSMSSTVAVSHFTSPLQVYSQGKKVCPISLAGQALSGPARRVPSCTSLSI